MKTIICTLMLIAAIIGVYCVHRQYLHKQQVLASLEKAEQRFVELKEKHAELEKIEQDFEEERELHEKYGIKIDYDKYYDRLRKLY